MKEVQLSQKMVALVDDEDFDRVIEFRWSFSRRRSANGYAVSAVGTGRNVFMHRFILQPSDPSIIVDHINGNGLDNRRSNLRLATHSQNHANCGRRRHNTSGFKGVHFTKRRSHLECPWAAYLGALKKSRFLGYFTTAEDAARAYDTAAEAFYGEFAKLNFPRF